jgi:very-short-patch-repair endonuclease
MVTKLTEEQRNKIRLARLGSHMSEETKLKISQSLSGRKPWNTGLKLSDETKAKLSLVRMGNKNNLGHKASAETREKMSLAHSGIKNHFFGKHHTEDVRETIRLSRMGRPTTLGRKASEETKARISLSKKGRSVKSSATRSNTYKALWQDAEFAKKQIRQILKGNRNLPNKPETVLMTLLDAHYPNEYKYVGDGSFIIGRFNPDFVNVNGRKQVIELFGHYWHDESQEALRKETFAKFGFASLIIWDDELNDLEAVVKKIDDFRILHHEASQSRASKSNNICSGQV